jgi:hypothetical protein
MNYRKEVVAISRGARSGCPGALVGALVCIVALAVFASPAVARTTGAADRACIRVTPSAHSVTVGHTTTYNRQASVQTVCEGFGSDVHFTIGSSIACAVLAAGIGRNFDKTAAFVSGSCDGAALASDGLSSSNACGMLSDLLGSVPVPLVKAFAAGASVGCSLAHPFATWLESRSEHDAALGVIRQGRCLKFSTHSFPLTDQWSAVTCSAGDKGFSTLPIAPHTPGPPTGTPPSIAPPVTDGAPSPAPTGAGAPSPGLPSGGYVETTGGVTHTWTNYTNAGGTQGPSIASNQTVSIACKLQGFRVADGNTWWYRIASSPWNSVYYASADAFYNNGATSGSLIGTPFDDPGVPDC